MFKNMFLDLKFLNLSASHSHLSLCHWFGARRLKSSSGLGRFYKPSDGWRGLNVRLWLPNLNISQALWNKRRKIQSVREERPLTFKGWCKNFSFKAALETWRAIFGVFRFSSFIWSWEVQNFLHGTLRQSRLKRATGHFFGTPCT